MLWIKAFHIIAIVCWFAGIFYLPRLFVYHAMAEEQATREHLKIMEKKLYRFMSIFAVCTLIFGIWLVSFNWQYYLESAWFLAKLFFVVAMFIYHLACGHYVKKLADDTAKQTHVYFRWFNELPVIALFSIVILVVIKPFS